MTLLTLLTEYDTIQILMSSQAECIALGEAFVMETLNRGYECLPF